MKKRIFWLMITIIPTLVWAHTLLLQVGDNDDDTLNIKGEFSTGEGASGALVKLRALGTQEILFQQRLPDSSELTVAIPKVPYEIILDGGAGHQVRRDGIAPKGGFEKSEAQKGAATQARSSKPDSSSIPLALSVCLGVAFMLLGATIFIGIYNTDRLIRTLRSRE